AAAVVAAGSPGDRAASSPVGEGFHLETLASSRAGQRNSSRAVGAGTAADSSSVLLAAGVPTLLDDEIHARDRLSRAGVGGEEEEAVAVQLLRHNEIGHHAEGRCRNAGRARLHGVGAHLLQRRGYLAQDRALDAAIG